MNILRNPNFQRPFIAFGLAATLGGAACGNQPPTPGPTVIETEAPAPDAEIPSCAVHAKVSGHIAHLSISTENADEPGQWLPGNFDYTFGDDSLGAKGQGSKIDHTYPDTGDYAVAAFMNMDVADTVRFPLRNPVIACDTAVVTIK